MATETSHHAIDTMFLEERRYPPPEEFAAQANAQPEIYDRDRDEFWGAEARERVTWFEPFETVCEWKPPYAKWFVGGKLNVDVQLRRPARRGRQRQPRSRTTGRASPRTTGATSRSRTSSARRRSSRTRSSRSA